ncbi:MAG TPA: VanW family protein [Alphaproteobacteria bacterium]|jgi:hypothetical protein|nr:VanW family protein [Alphaproteobacteria bacterium]
MAPFLGSHFFAMFPTIAALMILTSNPNYKILGEADVQISSRSFSLEDRYNVPSVNTVFKENILLTIERMGHEFTLQPGQTFAFHEKVLAKYEKSLVKTTNSHFNSSEGFKSDGYLVGDGVCHIASLIYWAAKDAGLETYAPSNHNFANIPDVPKEYGVAILSPMPMGNLYITNNQDKPVNFEFKYDGENLSVSVSETR